MKNIVIIGSSAAGVKAAEGIREKDKESKITLLTADGYAPSDPDRFFEMLASSNISTDVGYKNKEFYAQNNIEVIGEKKITRINFQRKRIFCEDKNQIEYDLLILTEGMKNLFPSIKGTNKDGVYGFLRLDDVKKFSYELPLQDSVIIQSDTLQGIQLAAEIINRKKEVLIICSQENLFSRLLNPDYTSFLIGLLEENGLRFIEENEISEILGDSSVKAVRLKSEKVIACQNVVFPETSEDLRAFQDLRTEDEPTLAVNDQFATKVEGVFALDLLVDPKESEQYLWGRKTLFLERQAEIVSNYINGIPQDSKKTPLMCSLNLGDLKITLIGELSSDTFSEGVSLCDSDHKSCKAIYLKENRVIGALLINQEDIKEELLRMILKGESFSDVTENPLESSETAL